jgi:hypothetical protein
VLQLLAALLLVGPKWASCSDDTQPVELQGVRFDGQTAFVIPVSELELPTEAISIALWVELDQPEPNRSEVFVNCGQANSMFTFYLYRNQVRMLIGSGPERYRYALAPPPEPGVWTHYAGSFDGRTIRIYRDGQIQGVSDAPGPIQALEGLVHIGALDRQERFLSGRMEDVQLWRRVLSDAEIATLAGGRKTLERDRDLAALWRSERANELGWTVTIPAGREPLETIASNLTAKRVERERPELLINRPDSGYRGIWYMNQPTGDEYVYKYSGGLGTYCANHIPQAWYSPEVNKTFFTYGGTTDAPRSLLHMVSYYDHSTGEVPRPTILLDKKTDDAHDNPVINLDDRGYIWIFSSSHGTARPSYISRSSGAVVNDWPRSNLRHCLYRSASNISSGASD